METLDCIALRRSVRKYKNIQVEMDKIGQILEAGRDAPSSGNLQAWKFILITDEEMKKKISEASLNQYWMADAPVHIVVVAEPEKVEQFYGVRGERLYSIQNCAAAIQNMLLAATDIGLGSCWVGAFEEQMIKRIIDIPDNVRVQAIITLGYPDEKPEKPWKHDLYTIVFMHGWGGAGRIKNINHVLGYHSEKVQRAIKFTKKQADKALKGTKGKFRKTLEKGKARLKGKKNF